MSRPDESKPTPRPTEFSCSPTYPAHPCHSATPIPRTHPGGPTAFTGAELGGSFLIVALLVAVGLSALFSVRKYASERFLHR